MTDNKMKIQVLCFFFFAICGLEFVIGASLPPSFKKCSKKDPNLAECLRIAIDGAIKDTQPGIPSLHMLPTDPIKITTIEIQQGVGRPVNIKLKLNNVIGHGLSSVNVNNVKIDYDKRRIELDALMPSAYLEGDYDMDGKFLVLPMKGSGKCRMDFTGTKAGVKIIAEPKTKNGKTHWDIKDFQLHIKDLDKLVVNFDNLFNGDKRLGDNTNKVLNENWKGFWEELKPSFEDTFGQIFMQLAKLVFDKVPENDIFLE